ncbi:capsular biosynthesis protein [Chryseobacterium sp. Leaf180]|uniref:GumC family protein n=1 Tax=Chryseobacterium sp. Leaf180 TaxID=1736289 RepID=UPI0006F2CF90|nr:tyrosine-protein kinase [Chryseobacterium sp. Leaf180]KQR93645.1 capsular biosynthesis protein [Chryseobacterium sp. Leaf180]
MSERIEAREKSMKDVLKPYIQKWYWFGLSIFIALVIGVLYIKKSVPVYENKTSVLIKEASTMSAAAGDFSALQGLSGFSGMGTNSIDNEIEIFKSKKLLINTLKDFSTQLPIYAKQTFYDIELYKTTSPYRIFLINEKEDFNPKLDPIFITSKGNSFVLTSESFKKDIAGEFNKTINLPFANILITKNPKYNSAKNRKIDTNRIYFKFIDQEANIDSFQKMIDVDLANKDASVIALQMLYPNKEKARDILNALVLYYNTFAINDKNKESKNTMDFIDDRILVISQQLGQVENRKENFKTQNAIVDISSEAQISLQMNTEAEKRVLELETQNEVTDLLINYLNKESSNQILPTNIGLDNADAASNIAVYNKLILDRNRLLESGTSENPIVKDLTNQIANLRKGIMQSLQSAKRNIGIYTRNIQGQLDKSETGIGKVPAQEKVFRDIERQQQIKENLYLLLLQKREEAAITMANTSEKARVIDDAYSSRKPVSPKKMIILFGALIFGVLLPALIIYLRQALNNKIITRSQLQILSETPVLSEIPSYTKKSDELIKLNDVSPMAESFRILVTNLRYMLPDTDKGKIIFVTSSVKGEGKTFISVNLALALASPQRKVLIIGSDIRNPQLQRYSPEMKNAAGLTEYLYDHSKEASELIHKSNFNSNCDFMFSGSIPPNPTELFENGRYEQLMAEVKDLYNFIILDTAPLMLVTDSLIFSHVADATIYVVRSEYSEQEFIEFANDKIINKKIRNTGFVLNDVKKTNFGYGNKFGYGYQQDTKKWWQFSKKS